LKFKKINLKDPLTWIALVPVLFILAFIVTALLRIGFPYLLTWMEGPAMDHIYRILEGQSMYGPPSIEFTPFLYPPLFYYVSALFMKLFGAGLLIPRLISLFSTIIVFVLIWRLVKWETGSGFYGLVGAGFFAGINPLVRSYLDQSRIDALFIMLLLLGFYILRTGHHKYSLYLSAAVFCLALFTKQQALPVVILIAVALLSENFKNCFKFSVTFVALTLAAFAFFQWKSSGWFLFYVFKLPKAHGMRSDLVGLIFKDLLSYVPVLLILVPFLFLRFSKEIKKHRSFLSKYRLYLAFFVGTFVTSWMSRAHWGGAENVLLPVLLSLSLLGALSLFRLERDLIPKISRTSLPAALLLALPIVVQFSLLLYNPSQFIPKEGHSLQNEKLIKKIGSFEGDVLVPELGYIPTLAGKKSHSHKTAIFDIMGRSQAPWLKPTQEAVQKLYAQAIRAKAFSAIIIRKDPFYVNKMNGFYIKVDQIIGEYSPFVHGLQINEWNIFVPIRDE
jgi:4-amino-4-deoxy-L-arabinose transferase-like glycosyltransferase